MRYIISGQPDILSGQLPVRIQYRAVPITYRDARRITGMPDNIYIRQPDILSDVITDSKMCTCLLAVIAADSINWLYVGWLYIHGSVQITQYSD